MACPLANERVWIEKSRCNDAEKTYFERLSKLLRNGSNKNCQQELETIANESENYEIVNLRAPTSSTSPKMVELKSSTSSNRKPRNKIKTAAAVETVTGHNAKAIPEQSENINEKTTEENKNNGDEPKPKRNKKKKKQVKEEKKFLETVQVLPTKDIPISTAVQTTEKSEQNESKKTYNEQQKEKRQSSGSNQSQSTLVLEIAKARQHIKNSLEKMDGIAALAAPSGDVLERLNALEKENAALKEQVERLTTSFAKSESRITALEARIGNSAVLPAQQTKPAAVAAVIKPDDEDDGVDLFASDSEEEDEATAKVREQRLAEYNAKKSKKPVLIAKSSLVLDVKPWDDETDLKVMETEIRKITSDGLLWGASKFVPVAFGIKKLSISCVVEDDKVSIDWLAEEIEKLEDYVQSVDVAAFNKI